LFAFSGFSLLLSRLFLQYFDTIGWVFLTSKTVSQITYTVLVKTLNTAQSVTKTVTSHVTGNFVFGVISV